MHMWVNVQKSSAIVNLNVMISSSSDYVFRYAIGILIVVISINLCAYTDDVLIMAFQDTVVDYLSYF